MRYSTFATGAGFLVTGLVSATIATALASAPAHASAQYKQIFCQRGYHRVIRHGQPVCVRNRPSGERAPECVHVTISNNSGNGPNWHVEFCGTGSGGDSPLKDWMAGRTLIVDGGPVGPGAVIFGGRS